MRLTIGEALRAMRGRLRMGSPDAVVTGVSADTRGLKKGDLFFALKGGRSDGHRFVPEAVRRGASGVVISRPIRLHRRRETPSVIVVRDTLRALGDLAGEWRRRFSIPVVAVTGSNGKTTTKDLIAALLARRRRVLKTEGNFNNLIGLPLTLFRLRKNHQIAVLEMGMNVPGEIGRMTEIARPEVGVITNIGRAHLQGLRSLGGVARAKAELLRGLPRSGVAVLNRDDRFYSYLKRQSRCRVLSFGYRPAAAVQGFDTVLRGLKGMEFQARVGRKKGKFSTRLLGFSNATNILAALAVADHCRIPFREMKEGVARFRSASMRMEPLQLKGMRVLSDVYNANPDSMIGGLNFLAQIHARRRIAVLGEMLELGRFSSQAHRELGRRAAASGLSLLFAVGPHARRVREGAIEGRMSPDRTFAAREIAEILVLLRGSLRRGDLVFVKGSRGMKMERVIKGLTGGHRPC